MQALHESYRLYHCGAKVGRGIQRVDHTATIEGACAEQAVAQFAGLPRVHGGRYDPDVGDIEVKYTNYKSGRLLVPPDRLHEGHRYVLVKGGMADYQLSGWCYGHEIPHIGHHDCPDPNRPPIWTVNQSRLWAMESFDCG